MPNTREKLIELICSTEYGNSSLIGNNFQEGFIEKIADHIISSGFIEELQNEAYDVGVDSALHNHFGLSWEDADGLRKEIKSLQEATRWIPVTERLPEVAWRVLVTDGTNVNFGYTLCFEIKGVSPWCTLSPVMPDKVTHWMPIPQPPREVHK